MAIKRFRPALDDCQHAAALQSSSSPKTLLRLARCQFALGSLIAASSTIKDILAADPALAPAVAQLRDKVKSLERHVANFDAAREKKEWGLARLALDKCVQAIESEGGEIPEEWRINKAELELARGNWEGASMAAKYFFLLVSLTISKILF